MPPSVRFDLRASRLWRLGISAFYVFLLIVVSLMDAGWPWKVAAGLLVALLALRQLRDGPPPASAGRRILALSCGPGGCRVQIAGDTQPWRDAALDADYLVTPWLVVLNLRPQGLAPVSVALFPDSAPPAALRHLRVLLRARVVPCGSRAGGAPEAVRA